MIMGNANSFDDAASYKERRERMVASQIVRRGVTDERVLEALRSVPRHEFVPPENKSAAYGDFPLPIGLGQTISQPYIVAYMTELLEVEPTDRVLEIGTGSGYQAAVLAEIISSVYTIEIIPQLADRAKDTLKRLGYANVHIKVGDGYLGWDEHAPYDAIIITAAAEDIPPPLVAQLKEGGRLVLPVNAGLGYQMLKVITKDTSGRIHENDTITVRFVPLVRE